MNKILSIALISVVSIVLSTGCSSNSATPDTKDPKVSAGALYVQTSNNEEIAHAIKKAAAKTDWIITEFKSNEVIAEKIDGEDTVSSSIKFCNSHLEFSNPSGTSDLRDAIEDELSSDSAEH